MKEKIGTLLKVIIFFFISPFIDSKDKDDLNFIYGLMMIFNFVSISDKNKNGFFLALFQALWLDITNRGG